MRLRDGQPFDVIAPGRKRGAQRSITPAGERITGEPRCHGATEQGEPAAWHNLASLPRPGRHHELMQLTSSPIRTENHLGVGPIVEQQDKPQRVATIEVPHFVLRQPMEEGTARWVGEIQPHNRRTGRRAIGCDLGRHPRAGIQGGFHRQHV